MDDIRKALESAWARVKDDLLADRDELRRRVVRRHTPNLSRPPREWCLAVRAGDTRLRVPLADVRPCDAITPGRETAHEVNLDRDLLVALCDLVRVDGLTLDEAADRLGRTKNVLVDARIKGTFGRKHIAGLGGKGGRPRPVLYAGKELDPSIRGFATADPAWSYTGRRCLSDIPDDFHQPLQRVPLFAQPRGRHYRDTTGLHPEHPAVDCVHDAKPRKDRRVPPPEPDYAAGYKWKDGEYLGYDWRNPLAKRNYERHQRKLALKSAAAKEWRKRRGPPSRAGGSLEFRGWRWICPRCGRHAHVLYWPIRRTNMAVVYPIHREELKRAGVSPESPWPTAHLKFACGPCHRVRHFSRAHRGFWNILVANLSCGLLYGHEVERPAWLTQQRKQPYVPRPNRAPSHRRLQVQELLLQGWTYKMIAAELGIGRQTVLTHAKTIYRQHDVHGRFELAKRLGLPPPPTSPVVATPASRSRSGTPVRTRG